MSGYTLEDFKNAKFAVNLDGRRAMRMDGGHWRTSRAEMYTHPALIKEVGWRPVVEAEDPEALVALIGRQATRIRELDAEADGAISLDGLRAAWENAEQSKDCRAGDTLIEFFAHGSYHVHLVARDYSFLPPAIRILHRAPQPEPWEGLARVLRTSGVDGQAMDPKILASVLHERGVRLVGGDEA